MFLNFEDKDALKNSYITNMIPGSMEPDAHGCAFAHPLLEPQLSKLHILRTHFLGTHKWFAHPVLNRLHHPWSDFWVGASIGS